MLDKFLPSSFSLCLPYRQRALNRPPRSLRFRPLRSLPHPLLRSKHPLLSSKPPLRSSLRLLLRSPLNKWSRRVETLRRPWWKGKEMVTAMMGGLWSHWRGLPLLAVA